MHGWNVTKDTPFCQKDQYAKNVKILSCQTAVWYGDAQRSLRRRQGSIDGSDTQYESRKGKFSVGNSHWRGF